MLKPILKTILLQVTVVIMWIGLTGCGSDKPNPAAMGPPPVTVSTMVIDETTWQPLLKAVATLNSISGVEVTGEISGLVTDIHIESGRPVPEGELLVSLDIRSDKAQLESLEATKELAQIQLTRLKKLVEKKMAPQSDLDKAEAEFKKIEAQVKNQKIMIDKKMIKAPFSGILGIRKIDVGQYLPPGMPIVSLETIDPIFADFSLPQQDLRYVSEGQPVRFFVDTWPDMVFEGNITAIEPKIDPDTRNFMLRGLLDNKDLKLRPGMFGRVEVILEKQNSVIAVPQTAINYNPYGDIIFVVKESGQDPQNNPLLTAVRRFVVTGETRGDQVAITEGLKPGEQIVIMGHHKLKEGDRLIINNDVLPDNNPSPDLIDQ
jgi:membrane fusion protein (multidrug efflux system)